MLTQVAALKLLLGGPQGVRAWNDQWADGTPPMKELQDCDLSGCDLRGVNLNGLALSRVCMREACLADASVKEATLIGVDLCGADLSDSDWTKASLHTCDLSGAMADRAKFPIASLINCHCAGMSAVEAEFMNSTIGAERERDPMSQWKGSDLSRANLRSATLNRVDLSDATLLRTTFDAARFIECLFVNSNCRHLIADNARFHACDLTGSKWSDARLGSVHILDSNASRANFCRSFMGRATLSHSRFSKVDFSQADLREVDLRDADLSQARGLFGRGAAVSTDSTNAEWCRFGMVIDFFPWNFIRFIGSLAIFTGSTAAVVGILAYVGLADWYNYRVERLLTSIQSVESAPAWIQEAASHQPLLPYPAEFAWALLAVAALLIGQILFKCFCPPIVQQYSRTEWHRALRAPLIEYESAAFSRGIIRYSSLLLYGAGGIYLLGYLALRIAAAVISILSGATGVL